MLGNEHRDSDAATSSHGLCRSSGAGQARVKMPVNSYKKQRARGINIHCILSSPMIQEEITT